MSATDLEKLAAVIDGGLCTRCGSCIGLSGGAISFDDAADSQLPKITAPRDCGSVVAAARSTFRLSAIGASAPIPIPIHFSAPSGYSVSPTREMHPYEGRLRAAA